MRNSMQIPTSRLSLLLLGLLHSVAWAQPSAALVSTADTSVPALSAPYGLMALWLASDAVTTTVLLLLMLMSLGSWYTLLMKTWALRSLDAHCRAASASFWQADTVATGMAMLDVQSPLRFIAASAVEAAEPQSGLLTQVATDDWISMRMQRAVEAVQRDLHSGLAFLATVGSVSPFVGLFGTVWGIYHALAAIGMSGQASIDKVAGPVGEALIMTALGLAVAVPAVLAYNWLLSRNKLAMAEVRAFANDLHAVVAGSRAPA
jgi:biopolymer transport protein ExbB